MGESRSGGRPFLGPSPAARPPHAPNGQVDHEDHPGLGQCRPAHGVQGQASETPGKGVNRHTPKHVSWKSLPREGLRFGLACFMPAHVFSVLYDV